MLAFLSTVELAFMSCLVAFVGMALIKPALKEQHHGQLVIVACSIQIIAVVIILVIFGVGAVQIFFR